MIVEKHISIEGNHKLSGEINVKGAKKVNPKENQNWVSLNT